MFSHKGLILTTLQFLGESFNFYFYNIFIFDVEFSNILQLLQNLFLFCLSICIGIFISTNITSSTLAMSYLYLLMDEGEQAEQTAFAHTLQWCCRFSLVKRIKHTWQVSCFLYSPLVMSLRLLISKLTTDLLDVETKSESVILKEFNNDWVLESLLRFKFSSIWERLYIKNYYSQLKAQWGEILIRRCMRWGWWGEKVERVLRAELGNECWF